MKSPIRSKVTPHYAGVTRGDYFGVTPGVTPPYTLKGI